MNSYLRSPKLGILSFKILEEHKVELTNEIAKKRVEKGFEATSHIKVAPKRFSLKISVPNDNGERELFKKFMSSQEVFSLYLSKHNETINSVGISKVSLTDNADIRSGFVADIEIEELLVATGKTVAISFAKSKIVKKSGGTVSQSKKVYLTGKTTEQEEQEKIKVIDEKIKKGFGKLYIEMTPERATQLRQK